MAHLARVGPISGLAAILWSGFASISSPLIPVVRSPTRNLQAAALPPVDSIVQVVVSRDAFRITRRPAEASFNPVHTDAALTTGSEPKPLLSVVGIISGSMPTAIIEGFPGTDGPRVVRVGDTIAGLRVRSIEALAVRVSGMDTTWLLKVKEPWRVQ